jgi:SAM-dependent methyltransferase
MGWLPNKIGATRCAPLNLGHSRYVRCVAATGLLFGSRRLRPTLTHSRNPEEHHFDYTVTCLSKEGSKLSQFNINWETNNVGSVKTQGELWGQAPSDWALLQEPKHVPLFNTMLNAAGVGNGTRFFDAGCGGGGASLLAAQRGALVSGLDAAEGLLKIARGKVPLGDFRIGDMEALPFGNDSFDVVIAANSIQYTEDRATTLRELRRVCAPEGRIVVGLFGSPEKVEFRHILQAVRDALPEPPPGDGPFALSVPGKLERLIEEAGLRVVASGEVNCPFSYPDLEIFWRANVSAGPLQGVMRVIGEEKLKTAMREAGETFRNGDDRIEITPNVFKYVVAMRSATA